MKKLSLFFLLNILFFTNIFAQIKNPTKTSISLSKNKTTVGDTIDIFVKVAIDKDWYIYATEKDEVVMSILANMTLNENASFQKLGKLKAITPDKKYDEIWGGSYTYFKEKGEFCQTIKILKNDFKISGSYSHQSCSETTGMCLVPKETSFSFSNK